LYKASINMFVEQTLNLQSGAGYHNYISASNSLGIAGKVTKGPHLPVSDTLVFDSYEISFNFVGDREVPTNVLGFTQSAKSQGNLDPSQLFTLTHEVDVRGPINVLAHSLLWFTNTPRSLNKYVYAETTLPISDRGTVPIDLNIEDWIDFYGLGRMSFVTDTLVFTHEATHAKGIGVEVQHLGISHTLHVRGTFRLPVATDLGIGHSLTYFEDSPCNRKNYSPFSGDNTSDTLSMPTVMTTPQYGGANRFSLYYPPRGGRVSEVVLRAPEWGDIHSNKHSRINRETRGGELIVFNDPEWPTVKRLRITITGLTTSDIDDLQDFMSTYLGQVIGLTDWEGHEWEGIIEKPNDAMTHDGKDKWTIHLTFEGEKIDGYSPGNVLDAAQGAGIHKDPGANTDLTFVDEVGGAWRDGIQGSGLSLIHNAAASVNSDGVSSNDLAFTLSTTKIILHERDLTSDTDLSDEVGGAWPDDTGDTSMALTHIASGVTV
jgi:hypothetical protein